MSEQLWAVIESDGVVSNVIVADDDFIGALKEAITDDAVDTGSYHDEQKFVDITSLEQTPGVGWTQTVEGVFVAPRTTTD